MRFFHALSLCLALLFLSSAACPPGAKDCFLCGGVDGIACSMDCTGHYKPGVGDVACECPQGEPCVCYCPYGGGAPVAKDDPSLIAKAPPCADTGSCNNCAMLSSGATVAVKRGGSWCLLGAGQAVLGGEKVWVLKGSSARFQYFTGSTMDAAPESVFTLDSLETVKPGAVGRMMMKEATGVYHFMITKDAIEQFEIRMNGAYTGIKGTEFIMEADASSVTAKVLDGTVEFGSPGKTVTLGAGQMSTVAGTGTPSAPLSFDASSEERWWQSGCCGSAFILTAVIGCAVFAKR